MKLVIGQDVQAVAAAALHVCNLQNVQPDASTLPAAALK
jgi:hypothetical protein